MRMKHAIPLLSVARWLRTVCVAVKETYEVATDPRSVLTQATDTQARCRSRPHLCPAVTRAGSTPPSPGSRRPRSVVPPGSQAAGGGEHRAPDAGVSGSRLTSSLSLWESDIGLRNKSERP
jgi:hypothetical protein